MSAGEGKKSEMLGVQRRGSKQEPPHTPNWLKSGLATVGLVWPKLFLFGQSLPRLVEGGAKVKGDQKRSASFGVFAPLSSVSKQKKKHF